MFLLIASIWVCNVIRTNTFILQDTYNVLLKDNADYKVDLIISAEDYEMIDQNQLKDFNLDEDKEKFNKLNNMAKNEDNGALNIKPKNVIVPYEILPMVVVMGNRNNIMSTYIGPIFQLTTHAINKKDKTEGNETEYDYDYLVNEYYIEAKEESRSNSAYHISKSDKNISEYGVIDSLKRIFLLKNYDTNCTEVKGIGLLAVKCLMDDYNKQRQSKKEVAARLWRIFQIWFLVYLAVAVPLWCTRGWCCCCLFCKFFKPRQTIEEAKRYVVLYPPGLFKTKNGEIRYEPSEREKECYEEFEHFIKTL